MLRNDERTLLSEAIAPPEGYQLDLLVGTSYTLTLPALLALPLSLTFVDWESDDGAPSTDPIGALQAVQRYADRITAFCQAGELGVSSQPPVVASWLEDVVVPVASPNEGGVFHPKVWVARLTSQHDGAPRYRLICSSRNLTFDRSWDAMVVLDGARTARGGLANETKPVADFIATLPGLAVGTMHAERTRAVAEFADELRRVRFTPPEGFGDVSFRPLGIPGYGEFPLPRDAPRLLVVSPFIGPKLLAKLRPAGANNLLVTRPDEVSHCAAEDLARFQRVCTLDEAATQTEATAEDGLLYGLHAKLFVADAGWHSSVWIGSANATRAGFETNVEFLVELSGLRSACGVDRFLGGEEDPQALRQMLVDVDVPKDAVEPDRLKVLERELDKILQGVAGREFVANVGDVEEEYEVELRATPPMTVPASIELRCWPLTASPDRYTEPVSPTGEVVARFRARAIEEVTAFFAFEVRMSAEGFTLSKRTLVRAELKGPIDGRRQAILRSLLKDPEQVLRFLRMLLAFEDGDVNSAPPLLGLTAQGAWLTGETPLLEALLRALCDAPDRISEVAAFVDDVASAGDDLLPDRFLEVFEPIRQQHESGRA